MVASWLSPRHWNCFERRPTFHHPLPTCSIPGIGRRKLKPMSVAWAKKTLGPEAVVQQNWWTVYVVSLMLWLPAGWERSGVAQKSGWLGRYDCTGVFVRHVTVSNFLKGVMLWPAMNCYGVFGLGYENFIHPCKMGPPWFQRVQFVGPLCFMTLTGQMFMWVLNDGRNAEILQKHTAPQMPHESCRNNFLISNLEILRCPSNCSNLSWPCPKWCLASHLSAWGSPGHQVGAHPGFLSKSFRRPGGLEGAGFKKQACWW